MFRRSDTPITLCWAKMPQRTWVAKMRGSSPDRAAGRRQWSATRIGHRAIFPTLLIAIVVLPLAIAAAGGWLLWRETWNDSESELVRTAQSGSEFAHRVLGSHVLAAKLVNQMLAGLSDEEIRTNEAELHERLKQLVPSVPMANTIALSDRNAITLLTANVIPVPRVSIEDREWVRALRQPNAPPVHISSVTTGRIDTNFFFGVSIRRARSGNDMPVGAFEGVVNVSVNPIRMAEGLETITRSPGDAIALVRVDGEILARVPFFQERVPPVPATSPLRTFMAQRAMSGSYDGYSTAIADRPAGKPLRVAFRRVGDLPVYIVVSRSPDVVVARWQRAMETLLAVAIPACAALGLLAFLVRRGQRKIAISEAEFRTAFEGAPIGAALADGNSGRILRANPRLCEMTQVAATDLERLTLVDLIAAEDREAVAKGGWSAALSNAPGSALRIVRNGQAPFWALVSMAQVKYPERQGPRLVIASVQDITQRKAIEDRAALLAREVDHRGKNMLAVLQVMVRQTRASSIAEAISSITGRIHALARVHSLLSESRWDGALLRRLAEDELAPYRLDNADRARIAGPDIMLKPDAAQSMAMVLHELATNAAKYGALSVPAGHVSLEWSWIPSEPVLLRWEELNGPPISPPEKRGLGMVLVHRTVRHQLDGRISMQWRETGLFCEIALPSVTLIDQSSIAAAE
jgi:PAS domain S-box-containing protein